MSPHPSLARTDHRPWPLPRRPWGLAMTWERLLFAHWPLEPAALAPLVPAPLELDTHGGSAWLGVVPFRMSGVRLRGLPPVPSTHAFPELNVRTYVRCGGTPGVWFFSLDAASRLAVWGARVWFGLPYFHARMSETPADGAVAYASERAGGAARFRARFRPTGPPSESPDDLERFLTERYALFALRRGRLLRGDIHHAPWPLQPAEAELDAAALLRADGLPVPDGPPPHLRYAERLEVAAWSPGRAGQGT